MLCAPAVACDISAPPSTPRGTSRSSAGLTTFTLVPLDVPRLSSTVESTRVRRRLVDLDRGLGRALMVDLERRVAEPEALAEQALQFTPVSVAIRPGSDDDMSRQRRKSRADLPDVEVMDLDDSLLSGQDMADLVGVKSGWSGLHEDPPGGFEQAVRGVEHERHHDQRGHGIGAVKSGGEDHDRGDRGGDRKSTR